MNLGVSSTTNFRGRGGEEETRPAWETKAFQMDSLGKLAALQLPIVLGDQESKTKEKRNSHLPLFSK